MRNEANYEEPIQPPVEVLWEGQSVGPCSRRLFGLLPPKHLFKCLRETGVYKFYQCIKRGCGKRRIVQLRNGHQPIPMNWRDVEVEPNFLSLRADAGRYDNCCPHCPRDH